MVEEVVQDPVEVPQEDGIVADAENNGMHLKFCLSGELVSRENGTCNRSDHYLRAMSMRRVTGMLPLAGSGLFDPRPYQLHSLATICVEQLLKSVNCPHKNRKGLFKAAALRKKLKANLKKRLTINYCDDCARLNPPEQRQSVWICVTCSYFGCDEKNHTLNHFEAQRSGTEHPLFFAERSGKFRCFRCDKEFAASEEGNGSMKTFSSDYNSFLKTKLKSDLAPGPAQSVKGGSASESSSLVAEEFDIPKNSQKRDEELLVQSSTMKNTEGKTLVPVKGLRNLGNTCFFNAIMQCLLQTHALALYIDLVGREDTIELMPSKVMVDGKQVQVPHVSLPLDSFDGPLNSIFASFLRDFRAGRPVQPNSLFKEICRLAPRFRGWAQQDSHELLHHLLDGLKTEEMARHKRAIDRYVGALENSDSRLTKAELNLLAKVAY
ncbi:unnamed protein product [Gongylonema pulchrum]|uniref:ubiquitinyl hydrolase 1 n=1 Tax=Gongylonema pulchrum TaxID=637853 RepID=A0A183EAQ5_9BILA|nr:unnamed protein product [Gongylonema pulchrum]